MSNIVVDFSHGTDKAVYFFKNKNTVVLEYPCANSYDCSAYEVTLSRGIYKFELYGASGGYNSYSPSTLRNTSSSSCVYNDSFVESFAGNTKCNTNNVPGAGGYIAGTINIKAKTKIFARVGGKGQRATNEVTTSGGFNGGGEAMIYSSPAYSGGGASDIRIEADDVWHRIIVAGGGGGCDDDGSSISGSGGAGGYPEAQGYWSNGKYNGSHVATQLYGFTFGQGESPKVLENKHENSSTLTSVNDCGGAGGGWFGGHASRYNNAGAGGGSSFILTKNASIPQGNISAHTQLYRFVESKPYAFSTKSQYVMSDVSYANGIRAGHGKIIITFCSSYALNCVREAYCPRNSPILPCIVYLILSR